MCVVGDGADGAFVVWASEDALEQDTIHVQRIDADGNLPWAGALDIPADMFFLEGASPQLRCVSDGAGGVILAWVGWPPHRLWMERVDASGNMLWGSGGIAIVDTDVEKEDLVMVSDGAGGAFVAWFEDRGSSVFGTYLQQVNSAGVPQWTANGNFLDQGKDMKLADAPGPGVFVGWKSINLGNTTALAQQLDGSGAPMWNGGNPVQLVEDLGSPGYVELVSDGAGGVYFLSVRVPDDEAYVQRLNSSGVKQWPAGGVLLTGQNANAVKLIAGGLEGPYVTWYDLRNTPAATWAVQRFSPDGQKLWGTDGLALLDPWLLWFGCAATTDASDQLFFVSSIASTSVATELGIYLQRVAPDGVLNDQPSGTNVSSLVTEQGRPGLTMARLGNPIVAWEADTGATTEAAFAQWPRATARLIEPSSGDSWTVDTVQTIRWSADDDGTVVLEYSTDNGVLWHPIVAGVPALDRSYGWQVPNAVANDVRLRLTRYGEAGSETSEVMFNIQPRKYIPFGELYLSFDPSQRVSWVDMAPGAFSFFLTADIDYADIGQPWQNATNGIGQWESKVQTPSQVIVTNRTVFPPGSFNGGAPDNWIVLTSAPVLGQNTPFVLVEYEALFFQDLSDLTLTLAPSDPSRLDEPGQPPAGPGWVEAVDTGECVVGNCIRAFVNWEQNGIVINPTQLPEDALRVAAANPIGEPATVVDMIIDAQAVSFPLKRARSLASLDFEVQYSETIATLHGVSAGPGGSVSFTPGVGSVAVQVTFAPPISITGNSSEIATLSFQLAQDQGSTPVPFVTGAALDAEGDPIALELQDGSLTSFCSQPGGCDATSVENPIPAAGRTPRLEAAWPNPFNPRTTIRFDVPRSEVVRLAVYDVVGRHVATLLHQTMAEGQHEVEWSGVDASGHPVSSGVYVVHMRAGAHHASLKVTLAK